MMWQYKSVYLSKKGTRVLVTTLHEPPDKMKLKEAGGIHIFRRVKTIKSLHEVIIVAKKSAKAATKKNTTVTDDELDELETVDDLDELEDEDVEDEDTEDDEEDEEDEDEDEPDDEDEDDEEEEDEEEPAPKSKKKGSKPRQSQAAKNGKIGTNEVADSVGIDARTLRMALRELRKEDASFAPDPETGRYQWDSMKDPQVKKIQKAIKAGLHTELKKASLDRLKETKAAERAEKDARAKTSTKKAKKGEAPAKKKKRTK
jgi:hypothetical protein